MFPVLFCALILLGVAYFLYERFDPIKSTQYKEIQTELEFVKQQNESLKTMVTDVKCQRDTLEDLLAKADEKNLELTKQLQTIQQKNED